MYDSLIQCMDDIKAHPEDYPELMDDLNSIGYTKQALYKNPVNKLINFVNNHIIEDTMRDKLGLQYVDPTPECLKIKDGNSCYDFRTKLGNSVELKTARSITSVETMRKDIEQWITIDDWHDRREFNQWLMDNFHRHVNFHNASYIIYAIPHNNMYLILDVNENKYVAHGILNLKRPLFDFVYNNIEDE